MRQPHLVRHFGLGSDVGLGVRPLTHQDHREAWRYVVLLLEGMDTLLDLLETADELLVCGPVVWNARSPL